MRIVPDTPPGIPLPTEYGLAPAIALRRELAVRNQGYAAANALPHALSYGEVPVVCYEPYGERRHGNFHPRSYQAILGNVEWARRLLKAHSQARRALPKNERGFWSELDSCMSSDALLMNLFCYPGTLREPRVRALLGADEFAVPEFGVKARVPLADGKFDRTEVDMRLGSLLVEAKLTEADFQTKTENVVANYRDFAEVFDVASLPQIVSPRRRTPPAADDFDQTPDYERQLAAPPPPQKLFLSYQLIRNVLAAHATGSSFCVLLDARRPDLQQAWWEVMRCVRVHDLRLRLQVLTWQELASAVPPALQRFLEAKYGIKS